LVSSKYGKRGSVPFKPSDPEVPDIPAEPVVGALELILSFLLVLGIKTPPRILLYSKAENL
jgi:hypothetical protein